ncbi:hypothetical protein ACFQ0T_26340 [Kitasatospora gansuensis]
MQAGDVGVVERDVGGAGAADVDPVPVQAVHAARVGAAGDPQFGGGGRAVVVRVRIGLVEREHGAVQQRRMAEQGLLVDPLGTGVQVHMGGGARAAHAHGARERPRDCAERRTDRGGDQDVGGRSDGCRAAARSEDSEPDLHRPRTPLQ